MRRLLKFLCIPLLSLLSGATVFGQQSSLSFLDGFGIELTRGHAITVTNYSEEGAYAILAVDLFPSPGNATGIFFCFPPFFDLGYEEQLAVLRELFLGLTFTFYDAAG